MQPREEIKSYVNLICEQIRWKRAHPRIAYELENHIEDRRDCLMAQGMDEAEATKKAIESTGSAEIIGAQLDRVHRPKPQWFMLGMVAALLLLGILINIFVLNGNIGDGSLSRRLFYTCVGVAGMFMAYFMDFSLFGKYPKAICAVFILLTLSALRISPQISGVSFYTRYELLLFPLAFASVIFAMRNKGYAGIIVYSLVFFPLSLMALMAPSISVALYLMAIGMTLLFTAVFKNWFGVKRLNGLLLSLAPAFVMLAVFLAGMNPYRWGRLATAFNPWLDPKGVGYWGAMTRRILSGAVLLGQGAAPDTDFADAVLHSNPDFLLTAIISRTGWIPFALSISFLLSFLVKGVKLCIKQKSGLGFFVSLSVLMTLGIQTLVYVIFNLGIICSAPVSLPLISYGNTATTVNLILIGFMLSVFRTGDVVIDRDINSSKESMLLMKPISAIKERFPGRHTAVTRGGDFPHP